MKDLQNVVGRCIILAILLSISIYYIFSMCKLNKENTILRANCNSYLSTLEGEKNKTTKLQLTIEELNYSKDTTLQKLNETRKQLGIKNKKLQALLYTNTAYTKTDTLIYTDTIFRDSSIAIDTLLKDNWSSINLHLQYPSTIVYSAAFKSEKHIIIHSKKETIKPPKKLWLFRLFQKKHTIVTVDVVEKNPYASDSEVRYVEIIK